MDIKYITPELGVSGQIQPADVTALKAAGFRAIICNRPDGEAGDQPAFAEIATVAAAAGVECEYLPTSPGKVAPEDAARFAALMNSLPGPVFAFCRSGMRSATLWSLAEGARGRPLPDILAATNAAGYDMSGVIQVSRA
jgi:sulfide:quinone oxidoreductase